MVDSKYSDKTRPCPGCGAEEAKGAGELNGWRMALCPSCGLKFACAVPTPEQLQEIYDRAYRQGEMYEVKVNHLARVMQTGRANLGFYVNHIFLKRFRPKPGDRLLEVGCATGVFLAAAKARGWDVEGIDISNEAIRASSEVHGLPVRQGTLESLDFEPAKYKAIVAWEVLEHLANPREFLLRARRLLRRDGVFACSVPNDGPRVLRPEGPFGPLSVPPVHLNFWTCDAFRSMAKTAGYEPLYLAPKRSLRDQIVWHRRPLYFAWNQLLALVGLREGANIYAVLTPGEASE